MQAEKPDAWLAVLQNMSHNLAARLSPAAGIIGSWDCANSFSSSWCPHEDYKLVIVDSRMNLTMLAQSGSTYTHNPTLLNIAVSHADKTSRRIVRAKGSSYHVCDYSGTTGDVYLCRTAQGLEAWRIYGFARFYSLTIDPACLEDPKRMAD